MKHPEVVRRSLQEYIAALQFRIDSEPNRPDVLEIKSELEKSEAALSDPDIQSEHVIEHWWCPKCERVYPKSAWTKDGKLGKYGGCPGLCTTTGRYALDWSIIAKQYRYPWEPITGGYYPRIKLL